MIIRDYKNDDRWKYDSYNINLLKELNKCPNWYITALYETVDYDLLKKYNIALETGTFEGNTTIYFAEIFDKVYTVEKFVSKGNLYTSKDLSITYKNIKLLHDNIEFYENDSPKFLEEILPTINEPAFILLDAHANVETPVKEELLAIKKFTKTKDHIIMIDDTLDINEGSKWPSKEELVSLLKDINPQYDVNFTEYGREILVAHEPSK